MTAYVEIDQTMSAMRSLMAVQDVFPDLVWSVDDSNCLLIHTNVVVDPIVLADLRTMFAPATETEVTS